MQLALRALGGFILLVTPVLLGFLIAVGSMGGHWFDLGSMGGYWSGVMVWALPRVNDDLSAPLHGAWRSFWVAALPGVPLAVAGWSILLGYVAGVAIMATLGRWQHLAYGPRERI